MDSGKRNIIISIFIVIILIPTLIILLRFLGDRYFYIVGLLVIAVAMIPFLVSFESSRPDVGRLVVIAVMSGIAAVGRIAFVFLPGIKPLVGIVMITGIALGPVSGFLTGAISGFVSNFVFGQGPWTPWQMFAFGLSGFIAGMLQKKNLIGPDHRIRTAVFGFFLVALLIGPVLDTGTAFMMLSEIDKSSLIGIYTAGAPFNAVHGISTSLTLLFLCRLITEKLTRIKVKHGIAQDNGE